MRKIEWKKIYGFGYIKEDVGLLERGEPGERGAHLAGAGEGGVESLPPARCSSCLLDKANVSPFLTRLRPIFVLFPVDLTERAFLWIIHAFFSPYHDLLRPTSPTPTSAFTQRYPTAPLSSTLLSPLTSVPRPVSVLFIYSCASSLASHSPVSHFFDWFSFPL